MKSMTKPKTMKGWEDELAKLMEWGEWDDSIKEVTRMLEGVR